jgi:multisubunit Na+/H+ antiporter MnhE subunit
MNFPETEIQALIVKMILNKRTEESLQLLSNFYNIQPPEVIVGTIKGKRKTVHALYVGNQKRIYATNSDIILQSFRHTT